MTTGSVARRYARALLSIGLDHGKDDLLATELERLAQAYEKSADLRLVLSNPVFTPSQRATVLAELLKRLALSVTMQHFARLLLSRGRMDALPAIARKLRELVDEHAGRVRAKVTSAKPLEPMMEGRLRQALGSATGKMVVLEKREDPSLLAGIVTQVGDVVYDGSLAAKLAELKQRFAN
jgi:F-type H+-transporting ATPase subunit delta